MVTSSSFSTHFFFSFLSHNKLINIKIKLNPGINATNSTRYIAKKYPKEQAISLIQLMFIKIEQIK